jgi:hemolysin III
MTARRGHSDVTGRQDDVPLYGRGERIADAAVHILGLAIALLACAVLVVTVLPRTAGPGLAIALGLYATGLLAMLGCSALYNMAGHSRRRELLRRLDHTAIFAIIAGTYTPVAGIGIGGPWGWALLGVVWTGAFAGAALKLLAPARAESDHSGSYPAAVK